ncbi:MAG: TolC family protein [Sedimentisphaerales bacterium]|nr:TolC family protein [Sedimentisphaerales bacterium]
MLLLFALAGCPSQQSIERDFQQRREISYQNLTRTGQSQGTTDLEMVAGQLSMSDCLELALRHNKDVQIAKENLLEAKGQMTEAIATALPTASFTGSALRNDNSGFASQKETYDLMVLARQPLYLGGLAGAAIDAAAVFSYMSQQQLRQVLHSVYRQVRHAYLDNLLATEMVKVAQQAKLDADEHLLDTEKQLKYGTGTKFDVLRARVRATSLEAELIRRQNQAGISLTNLLNVLGVSQLSDIQLTDTLIFKKQPPSARDNLFLAMKQRPELLIGEAMIRLARNNIKAQQAADRPKVYLQGTYQRTYPGFSSNFSNLIPAGDETDPDAATAVPSFGGKEWERTMSGGIVMEWPFFDGFATAGRVTQAKADLHRQQVTLRKLEQQVQFELNQAVLNLQSSENFVQSQSGNVDSAEESLRLAQVNYREGTGTSLDVISAQTALDQARADYITAVHSYEISLLSLEWAMGDIDFGLPDNAASNETESAETITATQTETAETKTVTEDEPTKTNTTNQTGSTQPNHDPGKPVE